MSLAHADGLGVCKLYTTSEAPIQLLSASGAVMISNSRYMHEKSSSLSGSAPLPSTTFIGNRFNFLRTELHLLIFKISHSSLQVFSDFWKVWIKWTDQLGWPRLGHDPAWIRIGVEVQATTNHVYSQTHHGPSPSHGQDWRRRKASSLTKVKRCLRMGQRYLRTTIGQNLWWDAYKTTRASKRHHERRSTKGHAI